MSFSGYPSKRLDLVRRRASFWGLPVSKRILIADDHESVPRGLRALLGAEPGWEICGDAVDGKEAVARATKLRPDVIVLDLVMPRMDGLSAAQACSARSSVALWCARLI